MKALTNIIKHFRAYSHYRNVREQLSRLNDRELADIGVARADIDRIAKGARRS